MTVAWVLLILSLLLVVTAWFTSTGGRLQLALGGAAALGLALLSAVMWWGAGGAGWTSPARETLAALTGVLAVAGGGPATLAVFRLVDGPRFSGDRDSVAEAGEVLRGGAWIGGLERAAVFVTLVAGWPEGLAVVLALKGLARYPELRGPSAPATPSPAPVEVVSHGVAERFIIGTFVSVLWAVACAGVAVTV